MKTRNNRCSIHNKPANANVSISKYYTERNDLFENEFQ